MFYQCQSNFCVVDALTHRLPSALTDRAYPGTGQCLQKVRHRLHHRACSQQKHLGELTAYQAQVKYHKR